MNAIELTDIIRGVETGKVQFKRKFGLSTQPSGVNTHGYSLSTHDNTHGDILNTHGASVSTQPPLFAEELLYEVIAT